MHDNTSGGYVGLLALLITCLLIALFVWRMDLFSGNSGATNTPPVQQDLNAIKAAENAKQQLESQYNQQAR